MIETRGMNKWELIDALQGRWIQVPNGAWHQVKLYPGPQGDYPGFVNGFGRMVRLTQLDTPLLEIYYRNSKAEQCQK